MAEVFDDGAIRRAELVDQQSSSGGAVTGHVLCPCSNQRLILGLSYVWPVATITGSFMSAMETGHRKCGGAEAVVEGEGATLLPWSSTPTSIFESRDSGP